MSTSVHVGPGRGDVPAELVRRRRVTGRIRVVGLLLGAAVLVAGLAVAALMLGVGLAYLSGSLISWLLSQADVREAQPVLLWTVGSVADVRGGELGGLALLVALFAVVVALAARPLRVLPLGDELASGLGIARRLQDDGGPALFVAAAVGALLTLAADVLGQHAVPGVVAPVGIVTGLIGAPYLLFLLARQRKVAA